MSGAARLRVVLLFSALLAMRNAGLGCDDSVKASLDQPFDLGAGREASISTANVVVRFVAVPLDSRCPKGEQCIVAGKARVDLQISVGGGAPVAVALETSEGSGETQVEGFQFTLVGLAPYPVSGRPIPPEEYVATLVLRRL